MDVDADEIALLARRGVSVVHNPSSNMKLASGVAPVPAMLDAGVRLALGSDGAASNNRLNMFTEMGPRRPAAQGGGRSRDHARPDGARHGHPRRCGGHGR